METKVLLILKADWADEFECQEYLIVDTMEEAKRIEERCAINGGYFGTNEGWEEGELPENSIYIKEIPLEQSDLLQELLGDNFGTGILWGNSDGNN